jgi:hypothetical protein
MRARAIRHSTARELRSQETRRCCDLFSSTRKEAQMILRSDFERKQIYSAEGADAVIRSANRILEG